MQNRYGFWQYVLLTFLLIVGGLYALPNVFGEEPAVQIAVNTPAGSLTQATMDEVLEHLQTEQVRYKRYQQTDKQVMLHFYNAADQFKAKDLLVQHLGQSYTIALNLMPAMPSWLSALGAMPMKLGLDLRGGVHFLLEVDMSSVFDKRIHSLFKQIGQMLRQQNIRYQDLRIQPRKRGISVKFSSLELREQAYRMLQKSKK